MVYVLDLDVTTGSLLCQCLVKSYDLVSLKPTEQAYDLKALVINAFKPLLAISTSAKHTAYEGMDDRVGGISYYGAI